MSSKKTTNLVERAIAHCKTPSSLASQLSKVSGEDVSRQRVHGWRLRGVFPRHMLVHVETLCGIPLSELVQQKPKDRDAGNVVDKAIRFLGADAMPSDLAEALSKESGERVTRQMVNGWQALAQFPIHMVPFVHMLTQIPVKDLVQGRRAAEPRTRTKIRRATRRPEKRAG